MISERRRSLRCDLNCATKLRDLTTGRYLAGRTINHSDTGVLVELASPTRLGLGQRVGIAIAGPHQGVIMASEMAQATVVRVAQAGDSSPKMRLGLRYAAGHRAAG